MLSRRAALTGLASCAFCGAASSNTSQTGGCLTSETLVPQSFAVLRQIEDGHPVINTTGNKRLDRTLGQSLNKIAAFFLLETEVGLYDDGSEPNAVALPNVGPYGTIALGQNLLHQQLNTGGDHGIAIVAIIAHEFAHIMQFQKGVVERLTTDDIRLAELNADFFAGMYIAELARNNRDISLQNTKRTFEALGDTDLGEPEHHGTPEERFNAIEFGFRVGSNNRYLLPSEALVESIAFVEEAYSK